MPKQPSPPAPARRSCGNRSILAALLSALALLYLAPVVYILGSPAARAVPAAGVGLPPAVEIQELAAAGPAQSGLLIHAGDFKQEQLTNKPFPTTITCGLGESSCADKIPKPRIRTPSIRDTGQATLIMIVFFPVMVLSAGGIVFYPLLAVTGVGLLAEYRKKRPGRAGTWLSLGAGVAWVALLAGLFFLPTVLRHSYVQRRQVKILWEAAPMRFYLTGGLDRLKGAAQGLYLSDGLVVVNGTAHPVDVYVDGFWNDAVPARALHKYGRLQPFTRLTSVDGVTKAVVDDFTLDPAAEDTGLLIYNVAGAEALKIENPPPYR